MERLLAQSKAGYLIVAGHYPMYSVGEWPVRTSLPLACIALHMNQMEDIWL